MTVVACSLCFAWVSGDTAASAAGSAVGQDSASLVVERVGVSGGDYVIEQDFSDGFGLRFSVHGEVELGSNNLSIVDLPTGSEIRMETRLGQARRRLDIASAGDARLEYRWSVDGERRKFDDVAKKWMKTMLATAAEIRTINSIREEQFALEAEIRDAQAREHVPEAGSPGSERKDDVGRDVAKTKRQALEQKINEIYAEKQALVDKIEAAEKQERMMKELIKGDYKSMRDLQMAERRLRKEGRDADIKRNKKYLNTFKRRYSEMKHQLQQLHIADKIAKFEGQITDLKVEERVATVRQEIAGLPEVTPPVHDAGDKRIAALSQQLTDLRVTARIEAVEAALAPKLAELRALTTK